MNLQIDVGNTFLKWRAVESGVVVARGGSATGAEGCLADFTLWSRVKTIALASVASVEVEVQLLSVLKSFRSDITPFVARTQSFFEGVSCAYSSPGQMGVDRWLALVAGYFKYGGSCCVVDCGSAITVDVINSAGFHEGGYILPGIRLMKNSLITGTKKVQFESLGAKSVMYGRDTTECVENGINYMIFSIFDQLKRRQLKEGIDRLFVTGGDAGLVAALCDGVELIPDLVLDGLALVSEESMKTNNS